MNKVGIMLLAAAAAAAASAKVTARKSFRGDADAYAYFSGDVRIEEKSFTLRADRAYVYFDEGSEDARRIVAFGNVAVTNGTRIARADGASFFRDAGTVDLTGSAGRPAEAIDASAPSPQAVKARRIRLWTRDGRVEVLEADTAKQERPHGGFGGTFGN